MQANTNEMDRANHTDETKWLLPAYVADKPHQPKYSQVSTVGAVIRVAAKIKVAALLTSILQYLKIKIRFFSFCNVNLSMLRTIINKKADIFSFLYT